MKIFDATTLPHAIRTLFELNNYTVEGPLKIHGAEIDLVARPSDPFGVPVYIEATIEYVDNDKYGKDVGKLALIGEKDRGAQRLIVSTKGFSLPVKERATESRILTLTYDELFRKFQRFDSYIGWCTGASDYAVSLRRLHDIYEEPAFDDQIGNESATKYLSTWLRSAESTKGWLVITGEYGTGKTALTKVLQYRWLQEYRIDPSLPLPIRIELRHFVRQFDARGLIHHFLDNNQLSDVPVDFVYSLIRGGRIVLLLDGYDEMAQYLHARERRACLEALAELSAGGAKGILTSRPNYFTEAEELQVFEVLYSSIRNSRNFLSNGSGDLLDRERKVDSLLAQFVDRFERVLRDLTKEQTETLIARVLAHDPAGRDAVLNVLGRVFRTLDRGDAISLSGKPVIISYLLDVVEGLKQGSVPSDAGSSSSSGSSGSSGLTEAQAYCLIIDQLMSRDFNRAPEFTPTARRRFLQKLAIFLSTREHAIASESDLKDLITHEFKRDLARRSGEDRNAQIDRY